MAYPKKIGERRIRESTGTCDLAEAERYLAHLMEEIRQAEVYGVRPKRTFREAATQYLNEATKSSIQRDAVLLRILEPFIGDISLDAIHMGRLQPFIEARKAAGWKKRTINYGLQVIRHMINLAAYEWIDGYGLTWLANAPRIKLLREDDKTEPYPLSWDESNIGFFQNCRVTWHRWHFSR